MAADIWKSGHDSPKQKPRPREQPSVTDPATFMRVDRPRLRAKDDSASKVSDSDVPTLSSPERKPPPVYVRPLRKAASDSGTGSSRDDDLHELRDGIREALAENAERSDFLGSTREILRILKETADSDAFWNHVGRAARGRRLNDDETRRVLTISEVNWTQLLEDLGYKSKPAPKILASELTASLKASLRDPVDAKPEQTRQKLRQFIETISLELDKFDSEVAEPAERRLEGIWRELRFVLEKVGLLLGVVGLRVGAEAKLVPEVASVLGPGSAEVTRGLLTRSTEKLLDATLEGWGQYRAALSKPDSAGTAPYRALDLLGSRQLLLALDKPDYVEAGRLVSRQKLDFYVAWDLASTLLPGNQDMNRYFGMLASQLEAAERLLVQKHPNLDEIQERLTSIEELSAEAREMVRGGRDPRSPSEYGRN